MLEVIEATLLDLLQVLIQRNLQQIIQTGLLFNQHLHHDVECLTVLPVKLHKTKQ